VRAARTAAALALAAAVLPVSPALAGGGTQSARADRQKLVPSQFAAVNKPKQLIGSTRNQIVIRPHSVDLMTGPKVVWSHPSTPALTLPVLYRMVHAGPKPKWLMLGGTGVYVMRAAIVQAPHTSLTISTPAVRQLRMMSTGKVGQEVYLCGMAARVTISGTHVTSWRMNGTPDPHPALRRPFVSYDQPGAVLTVSGATMSYLGGDSALGYGVVWGRGATGEALQSTFDHNFFGAYTNASVGVVFRGNTFRDNYLYGLDPHTDSRQLVVTGNTSFGNGSHGIIFSQNVTDSVVTGNRSFGNRLNGIMMDAASDRNLISGNRTWSNDGDGIVVQNSSHVTVRSNLVAANRVGVRITGTSAHNRVTVNQLTGNKRGIEVYAGPATPSATTVDRNTVAGGGTGDGIAVKDFAGVHIIGNRVSRFTNGMLVTGRAPGTEITGNQLDRQVRGIEIDPTVWGARLTGNTVSDISERGLVLAGSGVVSTADTVRDADIGIDVRNNASIVGARVTSGRRGINLDSGRVIIAGTQVDVREYGVNVDFPAVFEMTRTSVMAREPVVGADAPESGGNTFGTHRPPVQWLAVAGIAFIVTAVGLHYLNRRRSPACHPRGTNAPSGVRNAW
jgi:parallel beta-helix repeat protein